MLGSEGCMLTFTSSSAFCVKHKMLEAGGSWNLSKPGPGLNGERKWIKVPLVDYWGWMGPVQIRDENSTSGCPWTIQKISLKLEAKRKSTDKAGPQMLDFNKLCFRFYSHFLVLGINLCITRSNIWNCFVSFPTAVFNYARYKQVHQKCVKKLLGIQTS
jgi:hypothetical protein